MAVMIIYLFFEQANIYEYLKHFYTIFMPLKLKIC